MIYAAIGLFLLGAIMGGIIIHNIFKGKETPKIAVFLHGLFNGTGLILVLVHLLNNSDPATAFTVLLIAAGGGIILFTLDMMRKQLPRWLVILHPIIGVIGVILLVVYALSSTSM